MADNRKISDLTVDEHKEIVMGMISDVPTSHFVEAADRLFWKNTRQIVIETTGKDITKVSDVLCIRKTFDNSQRCRIKKEKMGDAILDESVKSKMVWISLFLTLCLSIWANVK